MGEVGGGVYEGSWWWGVWGRLVVGCMGEVGGGVYGGGWWWGV